MVERRGGWYHSFDGEELEGDSRRPAGVEAIPRTDDDSEGRHYDDSFASRVRFH